MISRVLPLLLSTILLLSFAAWSPAHAQRMKDSIDYTLDDGIMSPEEMMLEAQDIQTQCSRNAYQRVYFNCECLAGAFLQQREKLGPLAMQYDIYNRITNSKETSSSCANTEAMAARVYQSCLGFTQDFDRTELRDNNDYCTCAANKAARDFGRAPRLSSMYIQALRMNAMTRCRDPEVVKEYASRTLAKDAEAAEAPAAQAPEKTAQPPAEGKITGEASTSKTVN